MLPYVSISLNSSAVFPNRIIYYISGSIFHNALRYYFCNLVVVLHVKLFFPFCYCCCRKIFCFLFAFVFYFCFHLFVCFASLIFVANGFDWSNIQCLKKLFFFCLCLKKKKDPHVGLNQLVFNNLKTAW